MNNKLMIALALGLATVVTGCTEKPAKEKAAAVSVLDRVRADVTKASDADLTAVLTQLNSDAAALNNENVTVRTQRDEIVKAVDADADGQLSDAEKATLTAEQAEKLTALEAEAASKQTKIDALTNESMTLGAVLNFRTLLKAAQDALAALPADADKTAAEKEVAVQTENVAQSSAVYAELVKSLQK